MQKREPIAMYVRDKTDDLPTSHFHSYSIYSLWHLQESLRNRKLYLYFNFAYKPIIQFNIRPLFSITVAQFFAGIFMTRKEPILWVYVYRCCQSYILNCSGISVQNVPDFHSFASKRGDR